MPIEAASSASVAPKINAASLVIGKPVNPSTTYADDDGNAVILPFPSSSAGTISPSDGGEAGKG